MGGKRNFFKPLASTLTGFLGTPTRANPCNYPDAFDAEDTTYYHDGDNALPNIGDTVYLDSAGVAVLDTSSLDPSIASTGIPSYQGSDIYAEGTKAIKTNSLGVSITLGSCR